MQRHQIVATKFSGEVRQGFFDEIVKSPLLGMKLSQKKFFETQKGSTAKKKFFGTLKKKFQIGNCDSPILIHENFRCCKICETPKSSTAKCFGTVRQNFRRICHTPLLRYERFDIRFFLKCRRFSLQRFLVL